MSAIGEQSELLEFTWLGDACLEIRFPSADISPALFRALAAAATELRERKTCDGSTSSYGTIGAYWKHSCTVPARVEAEVRAVVEPYAQIAESRQTDALSEPPLHEIPVHYDGPDLRRVADHAGLTTHDVIALHSGPQYTIAAIGFLPYFGYLWGLDSRIHTPRLDSPRTAVPAGAVGIGADQTGIYPSSSPGGWNLIGQVESRTVEKICQSLRNGDRVQFIIQS